MGQLKLEVPQDLREMSFVLSQWGIWTRTALDMPTTYRCQLAALVDSAQLVKKSRMPTLYLGDDVCGSVDALMGILKIEQPILFDWIDHHYRKGIPLKALAGMTKASDGKGGISEHKVVQILVKAEEYLMGIARRIEAQNKHH